MMNLVVTPLNSDWKKIEQGLVTGGLGGRAPKMESPFIWVYNQTLPTKPNVSESLFQTS